MGALDQLRAANGQDGIVERARSNPRWAIAIATAAVLFLAWIAWAIYVTRSNGATAGLGVVLAWPAMLVALALISLPFIGGYLLIRRLSDGDGAAAAAEAPVEDEDDSEEEADDEDSEEEDEDSGADEGEDSDNEEDEDSEESDDDEETEEAAEKASD